MKSLKVLFFFAGIVCIISRKTVHCVEPVEFWDDDDDEADATNNKDTGGEIKNNPDDEGWWNWLTNNQEQDEYTETSTNKLDTTLQSESTTTSQSVISDSSSPSIPSDTSTINKFQPAESNGVENAQKQRNDTNKNDETSKSDSNSDSSSDTSSENSSSSEDSSSSSSEDTSSKSDSSSTTSSDSSSDSSSENSSSSSSEDTSSSSNSSSEESEETNESKEEDLNDKEEIHNENDNNIDFDDKINNDNNNDVDGVIEDVESTSVVDEKEKETWSDWFEHIVGNLVNGDDNDNDDDDGDDELDDDSLDDNSEFNKNNDDDNKGAQIDMETPVSHEIEDVVPDDNTFEQDGANFNDDSTTIRQTTPRTQYQTNTNYQRSTEIPIETPPTTLDTNLQTAIPSVIPVNDQYDHMDNDQEVVVEQVPDLNAAVLGDDEEHIIDEAVNTGQDIPEAAYPNPLFQVPKVDDQDTFEHTDNISCKDVPMVVAETCEIPNVIVEKYNKDITIEDVKDYIFHPSKVESLIKDCRPGEWCMEEGIPLTQMNVDVIFGLCPLRQCLDEINETCMTEERLLVRQSLTLLCELHSIETVSINTSNCCDKCLVNVIVSLHVQMADLLRQGREGVEQDVCTESDFYFLDTLCLRQPCSKTMARLMCLQQECEDFQEEFKTFQKWGGFFKDIENITNKCPVGNATCFNNSLEASMKGQAGMMEKFRTMFWKNGNWKTLSGFGALLGISLIGVICVVFMYMRRHRGHSYDRQDIEYSEVKSYDRL